MTAVPGQSEHDKMPIFAAVPPKLRRLVMDSNPQTVGSSSVVNRGRSPSPSGKGVLEGRPTLGDNEGDKDKDSGRGVWDQLPRVDLPARSGVVPPPGCKDSVVSWPSW
jgi:hypothetical protein